MSPCAQASPWASRQSVLVVTAHARYSIFAEPIRSNSWRGLPPVPMSNWPAGSFRSDVVRARWLVAVAVTPHRTDRRSGRVHRRSRIPPRLQPGSPFGGR